MLAVTIFAACGVYQLTPLKDRCLARCRAPHGFLLKLGAYRGRTRDLRAGLYHGAFCLACCWALMALLIAFGLMNVIAMVVLAGAVLIEKTWARNGHLAIRTSNPVPALAALTSWSPDLGAALPGLEGWCAVVSALEAADLRCEGGQISEIVRDQQLALDVENVVPRSG